MKYVIALCAALVLNAAANLMMKIGSTQVQAGGGFLAHGPTGAFRILLTTPVLLAGLICFALNVFLYMYALSSHALKISLAYPLMVGGGYAIIAVTAAFWPSLRERLTVGQWVGVGLILAGVVLIAVRAPTPAPPPSPRGNALGMADGSASSITPGPHHASSSSTASGNA